jgi:hypothetical protein
MYGLKAVPFREATFSAAGEARTHLPVILETKADLDTSKET